MRAAAADEPADGAPRYSEAAGVEHHPQVTDFLPRRYRTIGFLALVGVATTAAVEALHWFAVPVAATYGFDVAAAFDLTASGGLAAWLAAVLLLLARRDVPARLLAASPPHRRLSRAGIGSGWRPRSLACC